MSTKSKENKKELEEIQDYWTKERRDRAIPKPMPELPDEGESRKKLIPEIPIITPPNISIENIENLSVELAAGSAIPVSTPATWPWSCNGKLYFTWKGKDYVGSAGSIFLEILLTAGHNVYDEGEWSDKFLYFLGYPVYGKSWGWTRAAVFTAWQKKSDFSHDYAMILTSSTMKEVGSMGSVRGISPNGRTWTAIGYPAAPPYSGGTMYKTTGDYVSGSSIITMNNNDMTQGSSGGNWLTNYNGENYVNGVQSTRGGAATYANSPYLNNADFITLLNCAVSGNCK